MRGPDLKKTNRFWDLADVRGPGECWEWKGFVSRRGYGRFSLDRAAQGAHRVAFGLFWGEVPAGMMVMHSCDNRKCVNPTHLSVGTAKDNMADMIRKGRKVQLRGSQMPRALLNESMVLEARRRRSTGEKITDISRDMGIPYGTIQPAITGRKWRHVNGQA